MRTEGGRTGQPVEWRGCMRTGEAVTKRGTAAGGTSTEQFDSSLPGFVQVTLRGPARCLGSLGGNGRA